MLSMYLGISLSASDSSSSDMEFEPQNALSGRLHAIFHPYTDDTPSVCLSLSFLICAPTYLCAIDTSGSASCSTSSYCGSSSGSSSSECGSDGKESPNESESRDLCNTAEEDGEETGKCEMEEGQLTECNQPERGIIFNPSCVCSSLCGIKVV